MITAVSTRVNFDALGANPTTEQIQASLEATSIALVNIGVVKASRQVGVDLVVTSASYYPMVVNGNTYLTCVVASEIPNKEQGALMNHMIALFHQEQQGRNSQKSSAVVEPIVPVVPVEVVKVTLSPEEDKAQQEKLRIEGEAEAMRQLMLKQLPA